MGDIHGAALVQEILEEAGKKEIGVEVYAVGGHRMKAAGAKLIGGRCVVPSALQDVFCLSPESAKTSYSRMTYVHAFPRSKYV
jgi:hypothetical protein